MSRKLTSTCDGCGVEVVEGDEAGTPAGMFNMRQRHSSERWGSLTVATEHFPASFDLCEACTKRVVDLLELEIPKPETVMRRLGGLGGHAMYMPPSDFFGPGDRMAPPWSSLMKPGASPFSGLTPEDFKALGIEIPTSAAAGMPGFTSPSSICASCGVASKGPAHGICPMCGQPG